MVWSEDLASSQPLPRRGNRQKPRVKRSETLGMRSSTTPAPRRGAVKQSGQLYTNRRFALRCSKLNRRGGQWNGSIGVGVRCGKSLCTTVTAVTECLSRIGDTPLVNMVRRAVRMLSLSRATRGSSGKGKPQLASFSAGITSSRALPTSSAGYWSPTLSCYIQAPPKRRVPSGVIFFP